MFNDATNSKVKSTAPRTRCQLRNRMFSKTENEIICKWDNPKDNPKVSVCCITYNHEKYIRQALESFLMQETDFPFEILIHDDASTDTTPGIILEYASQYPKIIKPIIQTTNQYSKGGLINLRFVFPKANGKYVALCEGDDYWTDCSKLQKQYDFLENNPDYVITYTDSQPFNEYGGVDIDFGGAKRDVTSEELVKCIPLYTLTTFFRNVLTEVPSDLLSARLGDQVMWSLLGAYGKGKYLGDIRPAAYRVHNAGVHSKKSNQQKIEMTLITYNALFSYYSRKGERDVAQYFSEKSILLLRSLIGWKRLFLIFFRIGKEKIFKFVGM